MINKDKYVLGLMSGTSMDGLDCCLCRISIDKKWNFKYNIIDFKTFEYDKKLIDKIDSHIGCNDKNKIELFDHYLGVYFNDVCKRFLKNRHIDIIASHGQTILHESGVRTIQVGHPKYMHDFFKVPIIYNFRQKDLKYGGTGAPLAPYLDWLIFKKYKKNIIAINIGGISNLTFIPEDGIRENVLGFDIGPGMSLIDEYAKNKFNDKYDVDCIYSKQGIIQNEMLNDLLNDSYINKNPPKSTSRENYGKEFLFKIIKKYKNINRHDFLRTLVRYTSSAIILNINQHVGIEKVNCVILSGGGANHKLLVKDLKEKISNLQMMDFYNISIDSKEALLIAVMGYTCLYNITNNMPSVTGVNGKHVYGKIYKR